MEDNQEKQRQLLRDRGICVVIPTYNNGGTIAMVVRETLKEISDVIVVNDGSTDDTSKILNSIEGITIVEYIKNQGKGYALRKGFECALEMGFSYAITLDGDGQHYPSDIALFLKENQKHPGALIIGSLKKLHGLRLLTSRYEAELELIVFASWHGVEIVPIDIRVYYPPQEQRVSHFRPAKDFARISVLNTVLCFLAVVYGLPLRVFRGMANVLRTVYSLLFVLLACLCVITPAVWLYVKVGRMTERKRRNLHQLIYHASRFVMLHHGIPGTTFKYECSNKVNFSKPSVVICNHQSHLDLACQLSLTPNIVFLTNQWVWNNPLYELMIRHAEFYPVAEGIDELMPKLQSLVERGYSIAIYPEGTRSKDCKIGRFHKGAFYVAEQLGLEIIPMYLYGPGRILPKKNYHLRKGPIYLEVGDPIKREQLEAVGDVKAQASSMRKAYIAKYETIANQIEKDV